MELIELRKYHSSVFREKKKFDKDDRIYQALFPSLVLINIYNHLNNSISEKETELFSEYCIWDILEKLYSEQTDQDIPPSVLTTILKLSVRYSTLLSDISVSYQETINLDRFFMDTDLLALINVNEFEGKTWYSSEFFRILIQILFLISRIKNCAGPEEEKEVRIVPEDVLEKIYSVLLNSDTRSGNLFENLIDESKRNISRLI